MRMLVVYDIGKDSARTKVGEILEEFGVRVQKSAFEIDLSGRDLDDLGSRLRRFLQPATDRLAFYPVDRKGKRRIVWLGAGPMASLPERKPSYFLA